MASIHCSPIVCPSWRRTPIAAALLALASLAQAQTTTTLAPVTVTGQGLAPSADIAPFADVPLKDVPASATVIGRKQIEAAGARRLADLTQFDAAMNDAYNAPGYWDFLAVRGFTLDNKYNYRREGLPVNAETTIPLDNKERIEVLKGTSGLQAGVSAPGGLANYVVKRPTETDLREVRLEATGRVSLLAAADLGGRFGADRAFGYRLNIAAERLRPEIRNLDGERSLFALAGDWRIGNGALLEAEAEWSHKKQASQTGFSLLGGVLPAVPNPRLNLNNQPWVQSSVFDAATGTVRYTQALGNDWRFVAQAGTQHLKNDDYTAFPFGCGAEGYYDRFCADGTFDYYDYRSQGEKRRQDAASASVKGKFATGSVTHDVSAGLLTARARDRFPLYGYNYVGTGTNDGKSIVPADPSTPFTATDRDEKSIELSLSDAIRFTPQFTTWLGMRQTRLDRGYKQSLTTPWAALSYQLTPEMTAYASYGQGVESQQVPGNAVVYSNPGAILPALKSSQREVGLKGDTGPLDWRAALFHIRRPATNLDYCDIASLSSPCTGAFDGKAVHRGFDGDVQWASGAWRLGAGAMLLHAQRGGSVAEPALNGKRPTNVPDTVLRANAAYRLAAVPGLELSARLSREGQRAVLADNSVTLPAWTRVDAAVRYERALAGANVAWTVGVDNVGDKRYWKESPFQFGHVYLYPGAPRTFRIGMTATL